MKKLLVGISGLLVFSTGCSSMNNTERGAVTGGVLGGLAGTVIGGVTGHPGAGAAIGAGSGALLGGLVGNEEDRHEKKVAEWVARNQLQLTDIVQMSQSRVDDNLIINQITTTGSVFTLSSQDVIYLRQQGVSDRVIAAMQAARYRVVQPAGVVYVEPAPPPVAVGVGFGYGHWHRW